MFIKMYLQLMTLLFCVCCAECLKILVVYPAPIKSVSFLGESIVKFLIDAGHEVTYVTVFPLKNQPEKNLRQIHLSKNVDALSDEKALNISNIIKNEAMINDVKYLQNVAIEVATVTFQNENFLTFLQDPKEKFDVVIVDLYETDIYAGLSALYDCPMIWSYSMGAHWMVLRLIDEPTNPAYAMDYLSYHAPPYNFVQRVQMLWMQIYWSFWKKFVTIPKEAAVYKNVFGPLLAKRGKPLPPYEELIYNTSFMFSNDYVVDGYNPSVPQNFKFIGGFHIEDSAKPLPKDLQSLMDNSKHGVVYFSMGSIWRSKDIPKFITDSLFEMFGQLKQTVIWKYEESLPNLPENVHVVKWAPQQSILAHPKCLLFITHGGQLSGTEAIHFGVPTIGVPIYFDHFFNIKKAVKRGYALQVDLSFDLAKNLKNAIETIVADERYQKKAKEISAIYHDRPLPPGKELVHWVEHVARTHGALHLRSPALHVPWYQKAYLDLTAIILVVLVLLKVTIKRLLHKSKKLDKGKKSN